MTPGLQRVRNIPQGELEYSLGQIYDVMLKKVKKKGLSIQSNLNDFLTFIQEHRKLYAQNDNDAVAADSKIREPIGTNGVFRYMWEKQIPFETRKEVMASLYKGNGVPSRFLQYS